MKPDSVHEVESEEAMCSLAARLLRALPVPALVTLSGDLGAGKSVVARAMIRTLGHDGPVPSPTYAMVESYPLVERRVAHLDLFRLLDPHELYDIGFDDIMAEHDLVLIEWPEQGEGRLPRADMAIRIEQIDERRRHVVVEWPGRGESS